MRRTEFRLARVLRARAIQERAAKAAWSLATQALHEAERRAQSIEQRIELTEREMTSLWHERSAASEVVANARLLDSWSGALRDAHAEAHARRGEAERARVEWQARRERVEALEKLREKHRDAARKSEESEERKLMDEIAVWRSMAKNDDGTPAQETTS